MLSWHNNIYMLLCHWGENMKKTMIYLPDELQKNLKRLAIERECSVTALIREAAEALYKEDLEDIAYARQFLKTYRLGRGTDYLTYRKNRLKT